MANLGRWNFWARRFRQGVASSEDYEFFNSNHRLSTRLDHVPHDFALFRAGQPTAGRDQGEIAHSLSEGECRHRVRHFRTRSGDMFGSLCCLGRPSGRLALRRGKCHPRPLLPERDGRFKNACLRRRSLAGKWHASHVTTPLPEANRKPVSVRDTQPWAIELSNGQRCTLFTGATAPIAGMRINYGCSGGFVAVGDINRTGPVWKIFAQGEKSISLDEIEITMAWY